MIRMEVGRWQVGCEESCVLAVSSVEYERVVDVFNFGII